MNNLIVLLSFARGRELPCACPEEWVRTPQRGDGWCDPACNTVFCGFDSPFGSSPENSDCFIECEAATGLSFQIALDENAQIMNNCETDGMCGWGRGTCGYCNLGCTDYSGFEEHLADGECTAECNTALCAFDGGDCVLLTQGFCASGCFQHMLGDGMCQSECLNEACGNDAGDCDNSLCSAGCFPYMVNDGQCDAVCHAEACQWDGNDCGCSPGCTSALLSNDRCDVLCATAACDFDLGRCECAPGCSEPMRGDGVCDHECFTAACEHDNGDCQCAPGCLYADIGQCKPECQVPECNYDIASPTDLFCMNSSPTFDCSTVECYDAWGDPIANCDFTCEQCSTTLLYKMNCCEGCCSENYFPHPASASVCVRSPDRTTAQRPRIIYVGTDTTGTNNAYPSLSDAFNSLFEKYVEVRLLPGSHEFSASKYLIGNVFREGFGKQVEALKQLKLTSQSCVESPTTCVRAEIRPGGEAVQPFFSFSGSWSFEASNVEFASTLPKNLCIGTGRSCGFRVSVFSIRDGMTAKFANVTFRNFKKSLQSVIQVTNATLMLEDTDFINVMLHGGVPDRSLISLLDSELTYTGGSVGLLNNLWNYDTQPRSSGALCAVRGNLTISGVIFTNNFMALADKSASEASLIHVRDCWRVLITHCDFAFNVGRRGAVISIFTYQWGSITRNNETTMVVHDNLIEVSNCTFRNNTGTVGSSIYVHFLTGAQNILITNCTFLNEFAEDRSVIAVYSRLATSVLRAKSRGSGAEYPVPRFSITRSHFSNCNVGRFGLIALSNVWSARIERITVEEAAVGDARNASTNSLQALSALPGAHFPMFDPSSSPQLCESLFNFTQSAFLEIDSIVVSGSRCSIVLTATGLVLSISGSSFRWNRGATPTGSVLQADAASITLQDVVFEGNANEHFDGKGTTFITGAEASVIHCQFKFNTANYGAALYLETVQSTEMKECSFEHNAADMGGAVFVESSAAIAWSALSLVFRNNTAANYGGAICVDAPSKQLMARVVLDDVVFDECQSAIGSAIFVSEGVLFLLGTQFKRCKFTDNVSGHYGSIVLESVSGAIAFYSSQFERNAADFTSALYITFTQSTPTLTLADILFDGNNGSETVTIASSSALVDVKGSQLTCRSNAGTCLNLKSAKFACSHCDFMHNSAASGAALQLHSTESACEDCEFQWNSAEFTGGAVLVESFSAFACSRCQFQHNSARWQGGALFVVQQSCVFLHTTTFAHNAAYVGGFSLFLVLSDTQSSIQFSRFISNQGTNYGCINVISASVKLKDCDFSENFSTDAMGGLMLAQSQAAIESCRFTNQTGVLGVFIYAVDSNLSISKSLMSNGSAKNAGAAMALVSSQASVSYCTLEALVSGLGGTVTAQDGSTLSVNSCSFRNIYSLALNRGVITIIRSSFSLANSSVSAFNQSSVYGQQANMTMTDSSFLNGTGTLGGGVVCSECTLFAVHRCSFKWLTADKGVGVYLEGSSNFSITDSEFLGCEGVLSGATHFKECSGSLANCLFLNNSGDRGGAIYIAKSSQSRISITATLFSRNSARRGGALCWDSNQPFLQDNEYASNAAIYGPDLAASAVALHLQEESRDALVNVTSGESLRQSLVFELLDPYGQVVADDSQSIAHLSTSDNRTAVSGEVRVQAKKGLFFFADCSIIAQPGINTSITIKTSAVEGENVIPVSIRYCGKGEFLAINQCIPCAPGTYSLTNHSSCINCPSSAYCFGNFSIAPKAGYWRANEHTDTFFECTNAGACLGSSDGTSLTGACADGYEGAKCQACVSGYYQWGSTHCSKCRDPAVRVGLHVLFSAVLISAIGGIIALAVRSTRDSSLILFVRIFVNYAQVVMLFRSSGLTWPKEVLQLFNAYEVFGAFPEYIVSANCAMESWHEKLVVMSLVLPAVMLCALLLWSFATLLRRSWSNEFVSAAVTATFLAYPSVLWTMLESFRCEKVDSGKYWLLQYNLQCWAPQHTKYSLSLALPCVVLYALALPAAAMRFLQRSQEPYFQYARLGYFRKCWYWEFVVLYWKVLEIACFALLLHVSKLFPALTVFGVLAVGVLGTGRRFQKSEYDSLETHSLVVCAATLYIGLMLSLGALSSPASTVPWAVILALHLYFVSLLMWKVSALLYQRILKRRRAVSRKGK